MKIQSKKHILPFILPFIVVAFVAYAVWAASSSGIFPAKYVIALASIAGVWTIISLWLLYHRFATLRRRLLSRTIAIIMIVIMVLGAALGLYVLQRSLSTLEGLSDANSVTIRTDRSFNVFISGIDTYGDIANQAR